jgi:hypothetical protein
LGTIMVKLPHKEKQETKQNLMLSLKERNKDTF